MALLLCEGQQNWLRVVTVVFRTKGIYVITSTFFTYSKSKISRLFTFFLPCFVRFLELCAIVICCIYCTMTTALSWSHAPLHTPVPTCICYVGLPGGSWHKTWPSSTELCNYTLSQKKLCHFYFYCNFGKCWSIFKILSMSESERNGS